VISAERIPGSRKCGTQGCRLCRVIHRPEDQRFIHSRRDGRPEGPYSVNMSAEPAGREIRSESSASRVCGEKLRVGAGGADRHRFGGC
jgi:hypothetical protein